VRTLAAEPILARIRTAMRDKRIAAGDPELRVNAAVTADIISADEANVVQGAVVARRQVIEVDDFTPDQFNPQLDTHPIQGHRNGPAIHTARLRPAGLCSRRRTHALLKARGAPGPFSAAELATQAARSLLLRQPFAPTSLMKSSPVASCPVPTRRISRVSLHYAWAAVNACPPLP